MAIIRAENLGFTYPEAQNSTFDEVNFQISAGEFVLLCGRTGSGKTTLLRQLVPALAPHGQSTGELEVKGSVGFVQQTPDNQIVTDIVFHELAFALENQGLPTQTIRRKVAEIASYFGLEYLLEAKTHSLSGGQKQILNLAATLVAEPDILVLDEPTSELDPIAAQNFLRHLARINRELGTTVVCCEHRLDEVLDLCDRVLLMSKAKGQDLGKQDIEGRNIEEQNSKEQDVQSHTAQQFVQSCLGVNRNFALYLPEPTRIALAAASAKRTPAEPVGSAVKFIKLTEWPLDVKSGRTWLIENLAVFPHAQTKPSVQSSSFSSSSLSGPPAITIRDLCFRYEREEPFIIRYLNATFSRGNVHGIVGGNASGKSTLLGLISGIHRSQLGKVRIDRNLRLAALPQNPKANFVCDTVREDLHDSNTEIDAEAVLQVARDMDITHLLNSHPYDLSGGETQKAVLAKLLLKDPDILLLDEPTKGLDAQAKQEIGRIFDQLAQQGKTLIIVTHDLSFAAEHTQTCSLLANGELIAQDQTHNFFLGNSFYTTPTNRMSRGIVDDCVIADDILRALKLEESQQKAQEAPLL
ncbi:MAG: ATP-binding cassette domain-containing protein [Coriobacteriia bacterium]|nr:ATP-binding cassette domain-containing protein [Coriobacteriia bacterium]